MYLEDMVAEFYFTKLSLNRENLTNQTIFKDTPGLNLIICHNKFA